MFYMKALKNPNSDFHVLLWQLKLKYKVCLWQLLKNCRTIFENKRGNKKWVKKIFQ